ncbi:MAG TPA: 50S ribosomal protein L15 [Synergistaceae bacterium]|jgi:large subunit ribosomal protein L15|nr:50S ribosomal protein L15 [Synergistaceae bacterium]PKL05580.1 MAG: 50S ribosomal protein L15 [Synergistetes bacterium HGW-Synergistetes-1]MBP9558890.1 50S ribosomal protein L15 [Synergistaceae bacterium]MBP9974798.1 50S ribosomal protein L15 [Synergistaceae bacterium]MCE5183764.1 50S ribosomal protein L15 [Synergistaceae bacterium]
MNLHELCPAEGSRKKKKRLGQGLGSGKGKTAGKGHKGQKARAGVSIKANFEGGQMPLARRIPKRGFSNFRFAVRYEIVNVADLEERFDAGSEVTAEGLYALRLISGADKPVKILGVGELSKNLIVHANAYSASAANKIEAAGGKAEVI